MESLPKKGINKEFKINLLRMELLQSDYCCCSRFNPFSLELDGWAEEIMYDDNPIKKPTINEITIPD